MTHDQGPRVIPTKMMTRWCGLMVLLLVGAGRLTGGDSHDDLAAAKFDSLFRYFADKRGFNGNVLIAQDGRVIYKNALGYANLRTKEPLNVSSVFQIASVTKQFTAVAVMMLHDEGKLDFADSVQKFLPGFPYTGITIRQLLTHRSGLPEYMGFAGKYWPNRRVPLTNEDLLRLIVRYKPQVQFKPDQRYRYSNSGYAVLALIVSHVSGMSYEGFLRNRILGPLEMTNTFVYGTREKESAENLTKGHYKNKRPAEEDYLSGVIGDKGIFSAVEDMLKWDQALYTDRLVRPETLEEAFMPQSIDRRHNSYYGFGWRIEYLEAGEKVVYHAGWWRGYNSLFVRRLSDRTAIIVLSNKVNWSFRNTDQLLAVLEPEKDTDPGVRAVRRY